MIRTKNIRTSTLLILIIFVLALQACGGAVDEPVDMAPVKLTVQVLPFISYGPLYIGEAEGFFTEQNLEVEFVQSFASNDVLPLVILGDMDVFTSSVTPGFINAIASGETLKVVADRGFVDPDGCSYLGIIVRNEVLDSGRLEGSSEDVRGIRIVQKTGTFDSVMFDVLFSQLGYSFDDFQAVDIARADRIGALINGSLDILISTEPGKTNYVNTGVARVWKNGEDVIPGYQLGIMAFGPSLLEDNPDAGRRFMVAYMKGLRQFSEGKTERNLEIMVAATTLDVELLKEVCWPSFRSNGYAPFDGFTPFQDWAQNEGLLDGTITEDQYFDSSFVDYANKELD